MIPARAANHSGDGILCGAAHRVYFDNPPLKGLRLEPFRFHLETCGETTTYAQSAFSAVPFATVGASAERR